MSSALFQKMISVPDPSYPGLYLTFLRMEEIIMSYLIYIRKSRRDAELEALGIDVLERHEKTLLELAKSRNLPIGAIYREVVSGDSIDARPEMTRLLSEVEAGLWDGVLVMEVERLARGDTIDQGRVQRAFLYSGTVIVTPVKTYDPRDEYDNEYFEFSLFMSRREYATIKRRLQNGRLRSAKDGYFAGNVPPYGWKRVEAPDRKHYILAPDETEAPTLQLMFDLVGNKQYGYQKACSTLTDMGIYSRSGKPFNPATLHGIISNPAHIGKVRWNWRKTQKHIEDGIVAKSRPKSDDYLLSDASWEGQIDEELFHRANTRVSALSAPVRDDRPIQNIFAGLARCSACGRVLVRKKANAKMPYDYLICPYRGCGTVGVRSDELEAELIKWFRNYVDKYQFEDIPDDTDIRKREAAVRNLERQRQTLLKQRGALFDLLEQGVYTTDIFLERSNTVEKKMKDCETDICAARDALADAIAIQNDRKSFIPRCQNLLDSWDSLDTPGKNTALKSLVEKIVLTKTKKNTRSNRDSEFTIDVFPKVPR